MKQIRWMKFAILLSLFVLTSGRGSKYDCLKMKQTENYSVYNHTLATIIAEYASAVYLTDLTELFTWTCSRCNGLTEGFEIIELIVDVKHCLQAYVGYAKNLNAVIVAFRGTQWNSLQNWVQDLYWTQLDLHYPDMPDAMVHHGFYYAYHNTTVRPAVLNAIRRAKEAHGNIDLLITGHSMGGAMAAFCALDLKISGETGNIQVMTFGQPRIGNAAFASHYIQRVPRTIRVTHEHDIVPHLPPHYHYFSQKTYHHFPREVWIHSIDNGCLIYTLEELCDTSGEDPSCSRSVIGRSIPDHLKYFGLDMGCYDPRTCKIVVDPRLDEFTRRDIDGNTVFSRYPNLIINVNNNNKSTYDYLIS
ncbi:lipase-like [Impatiens glandulifera]|uniref:lipase-like n=1 Tax=Impatiens glandulifera TaxID=253017 RepID=UPI001FB157B2|nr:lipase-like [Impatiens glandulifera]